MSRVTVVVGAQYGSEGKGAIAGFLSRSLVENDVAVRVAGPNAGHTAYDPQGREWKLRCIPVAAVTNTSCQLHIGAGSEVDISVLDSEIRMLEEAGHVVRRRLSVHPSATVLTHRHQSQEAEQGLVGRIGSTGKGIGAARVERLQRVASTFGEWCELAPDVIRDDLRHLLGDDGPFEIGISDVLIEGTQGYGLGLHTEAYPHVTSSDCRAIDMLAMAGVMPWAPEVTRFDIVLVARVYPIRVAGNSGPLKDETTWEALGLPEERTTVTNKIRRVGHFDDRIVHEAIQANGGGRWGGAVELAITMLDQLYPQDRGVAGVTPSALSTPAQQYLLDMEHRFDTKIRYVGTSPTTVSVR